MDKVMQLYVRMVAAIQEPRKGQGLVEYALIIALVSIFLIVALQALGLSIEGVFDRIGDTLDGV